GQQVAVVVVDDDVGTGGRERVTARRPVRIADRHGDRPGQRGQVAQVLAPHHAGAHHAEPQVAHGGGAYRPEEDGPAGPSGGGGGGPTGGPTGDGAATCPGRAGRARGWRACRRSRA